MNTNYIRAALVTGLVVMLGGISSWGALPGTNDTSTSDGRSNTGGGAGALEDNTTGTDNTAYGSGALESNTTGANNTACGAATLKFNTSGHRNTAIGSFAQGKITKMSLTTEGYVG